MRGSPYREGAWGLCAWGEALTTEAQRHRVGKLFVGRGLRCAENFGEYCFLGEGLAAGVRMVWEMGEPAKVLAAGLLVDWLGAPLGLPLTGVCYCCGAWRFTADAIGDFAGE